MLSFIKMFNTFNNIIFNRANLNQLYQGIGSIDHMAFYFIRIIKDLFLSSSKIKKEGSPSKIRLLIHLLKEVHTL